MIRPNVFRSKVGLVIGLLSVVTVSQADFTYSKSDTLAQVQIGQQNASSWSYFSEDKKTSAALNSANLMATDDYTGTQDNGQALTYNGNGIANLKSTLTASGFKAAFETQATATYIAGYSAYFVPGAESAVSAEVKFSPNQSADYAITVLGTITQLQNSGLGGAFSYQAILHDETTNVWLFNDSPASASQTIIPFKTTVSLTKGDVYDLSFYEISYTFASGYGDPSTSSIGMNGVVQVGNVSSAPSPGAVVAFGIGALSAFRRRKVTKNMS